MKMLQKLMEKKQGQEIDPMYKDAKMSMLHELHKTMSGMMGDDLKNAKGIGKVEVAGDSPDALSAGLDQAKDMVGSPDGSDSDEGSDDQAEDGSEDAVKMIGDLVDHETAEGEMTADDIDALMQMLEQKKADLSSSSDHRNDDGSMHGMSDELAGEE